MRSTKKASVLLFTTAVVLVPAAAFTACDADDATPGGATLLDGSATDAHNTTDAKGTPTDSGNTTDANPSDSGGDANQPNKEAGTDSGSDAGSDADAATTQADADAGGDNDADADAGPTKPTSLDDATYKITAWTCKGTTDVLAYATGTAGIGEIDLTVSASSKLDILFAGGDCVRSNAVVVTYPEAGKVTTTSNAADTCSGTCTTQQCDVGTVEPVLVDTYDFTKTTTTFTGTRSFPAGRSGTLAALAGCAENDAESVTYTKK